jgi:hypothetical protein
MKDIDPARKTSFLSGLSSQQQALLAQVYRTFWGSESDVVPAPPAAMEKAFRLLRQIRLSMTAVAGRPVPTLLCRDGFQALLLLTLLKSPGGTGLAFCPRCNSVFYQGRGDMQYCTFRAARFRTKSPKGKKSSKGSRS